MTTMPMFILSIFIRFFIKKINQDNWQCLFIQILFNVFYAFSYFFATISLLILEIFGNYLANIWELSCKYLGNILQIFCKYFRRASTSQQLSEEQQLVSRLASNTSKSSKTSAGLLPANLQACQQASKSNACLQLIALLLLQTF